MAVRFVRILALLVALTLVGAACGGDDSSSESSSTGDNPFDNNSGDDPVTDDDSTTTSGDSGTSGTTDGGTAGDDASVAAQPAAPPIDVSTLVFDASALPTDPVPVSMVNFDGIVSGTPDTYPEPLVDSCAALDVATMNAILTEYDNIADWNFNQGTVGPACRFAHATHIVDVIVHTPNTLDDAYMEGLLPLAGGDIAERPTSLGDDASVWTEDSFGVTTPYAAKATRGDWAVVVRNFNGTGLLIGDEQREEGWAAIAVAALDGAQGLTPGDLGAATEPRVVADPCELYEPADLEAVFGLPLEENSYAAGFCEWRNRDAQLTIEIEALPEGLPSYILNLGDELGNDRFDGSQDGRLIYMGDDYRLEVKVLSYTDGYGLTGEEGYPRDTDELVAALLDNVEARVS